MKKEKNESSEKVTIVRKAKKNNFSIISNAPVRNKELSWKSKGILWYLLQLPDDWKINLSHLQGQSKDGRDSLKSGFKELKDNGYIEHQTERKKGKIVSHIWIVHEEPILKINRDDRQPEVENPSSGFTTCGESTTTNNLDSESILKTKEKSATEVAISADADALTSFFIEKLKERKQDFKLPDRKHWVIEMDRLIQIDKRDPKKTKAMIEWVHLDPFWSTNILSPQKLRQHYDQIELQALGKHQKDNIAKNREWAIRNQKKYPESYKNLIWKERFVSRSQSGIEIPLNLETEQFKRLFTKMCGIDYDDLSQRDKQ